MKCPEITVVKVEDSSYAQCQAQTDFTTTGCLEIAEVRANNDAMPLTQRGRTSQLQGTTGQTRQEKCGVTTDEDGLYSEGLPGAHQG